MKDIMNRSTTTAENIMNNKNGDRLITNGLADEMNVAKYLPLQLFQLSTTDSKQFLSICSNAK